MKSKTCKEEGCNNPVWSGGKCRNHIPPSKGLKKSYPKNRQGGDEMRSFFLSIWNKRPHKCQNCGQHLGNEPLSYMFDHILEKSKYPDLAFEEGNICILCLECHDNKTQANYTDFLKNLIISTKKKFGK